MFQVPILVLDLVVKSVVGVLASCWFSPAHVMVSVIEGSCPTKFLFGDIVAVSVIKWFLPKWVVSPEPTSNLEDQFRQF